MKIEIIRPKPFRWIRSRRRDVFDLYKELIRPVKFLARERSPKLAFRGPPRKLELRPRAGRSEAEPEKGDGNED